MWLHRNSLYLKVFEVLTQVWEGILLNKRRRGGDTPGKGGTR